MEKGEALEEGKDTFFPSPFSRSPPESGVQDPSHNPMRHDKFQSTAPDAFLSLTTFTAFPHTEVVKTRLIYALDDKYGRPVTLWAVLSSMARPGSDL